MVLSKIVAEDKQDRLAFAGDRDLPSWCLSFDVYQETDADVLVARITLGSTIRWLGVSRLERSGALKRAWDSLFDACRSGDVDLCRYWQKEVARRRSDSLGGGGSQGLGVPRCPVPPRLGFKDGKVLSGNGSADRGE